MKTLEIGPTRLIAILHVEDSLHARPLLETLEEAGIEAIEVTLRSNQALGVLETMARHAQRAIVGAGTVVRPDQVDASRDAGARFLVGPAFSERLAAAASTTGLPFIPGVATPSEVLVASEHGHKQLKFFPSELLGGVRWLHHIAPLFPDVSFCPTAGITDENMKEFHSMPNVFAVGGMYMAPRQLIERQAWSEIRQLAELAVRAARGLRNT